MPLDPAVVEHEREAAMRPRDEAREASAGEYARLSRVDLALFEEIARANASPLDVVPTPWETWNRACLQFGGRRGLARGWHVVVGGAPGAGKSLVALNMTATAIEHGHTTAWVSLEMSRYQLLLRLLGIATGVTLKYIEPGHLYREDVFTGAAADFLQICSAHGASLFVSERPQRSLSAVMTELHRAVDEGARVLIVDYLQLIHVPGVDRRDEAMQRVSNDLQGFCYQQNVNLVVLSQLNRSTTSASEAPQISGFAGSSAIENDADQALLIDHSSKEKLEDGELFRARLAKNRHGKTVKIDLWLENATLRIQEKFKEVQPASSTSAQPNRKRAPQLTWHDRLDT